MCKYCDLDKDGIAEPLVSGLGVCCELVIEKNNYYLVIYGDSEVYSEPVHYCPFCGKSLKVEVKPTTPEECATVFDYLRLLDTFTERKGPAYEKWRYADLPILPKEWNYQIADATRKQFGILKKLMERDDVSGLVEATDVG